jgi:hypothetical protein
MYRVLVFLSLFLRSVFQLLVTASVFPSSLILFTLMMNVKHSTETSVLTGATRITSHKIAFFMVTAVEISNLT